MRPVVRYFTRLQRRLAPLWLIALTAAPPVLAETPQAPRLVEVIIADLSNPFFAHLARQIETSLAEASPGTEVVVRSSGYDLNRQQRQIRDAVLAGADFLIVNAVNTTGLSGVIAEARTARIPVIAVDVKAAGADAFVTSDNFEAGRIACDYITERLGGRGNVLILYGPPVSAVFDRNAGCEAVLDQHPGITILTEYGDSGGSRLGGLTYMSQLLPRLPHIDAVFSFNDPTSLGVLQAAREAGRNEFFIVSVDASPEGIRAMAEEGSLLVASVAQYPKAMADQVMTTAMALWRGETVAERELTVPVQLLTREMLAKVTNYWMDPL
ncbi:substrate-binding domain-containing protein [Pseudogemmobacter faecipullorum]|uniref:Substrate-binding domain-containing protein n=1 Tax=Pseudogemmobacter faecipullorum TaxID=2755041 RepID=A0ABS8CNC9_9RHOB|nr:substrate-binding domain-containing protein [Pseudogemmobacter faecipullorum]MCB5410912.1 substrate-binding domain-containing protein [Pseudogemmobacter faecipullorum]